MHWVCESFNFVRQADKRLINPLINNSEVRTKWHEETHYVNLYLEMSSSPKSGESPFLGRLIVNRRERLTRRANKGWLDANTQRTRETREGKFHEEQDERDLKWDQQGKLAHSLIWQEDTNIYTQHESSPSLSFLSFSLNLSREGLIVWSTQQSTSTVTTTLK